MRAKFAQRSLRGFAPQERGRCCGGGRKDQPSGPIIAKKKGGGGEQSNGPRAS